MDPPWDLRVTLTNERAVRNAKLGGIDTPNQANVPPPHL